MHAGEDLTFAPAAQPKGNLGLEDGFLLSVGGETRGWRVCEGDLGQQVVSLPLLFYPTDSPRLFSGRVSGLDCVLELDADLL